MVSTSVFQTEGTSSNLVYCSSPKGHIMILEAYEGTLTPAVNRGSVGTNASEDVRRLADEGCSPTVGERPATT